MAGTVPLTASTVPHPRRPLVSGSGTDSGSGPAGSAGAPVGRAARLRHWYENDLGWATVPAAPGEPLRLVTGVRFDVLDMPAEAGARALRHLGPGAPVALQGGRMRLLVAAGGAEELPGLLDWLEWGALAPVLDLRALGDQGWMDAPPRPEPASAGIRPFPESARDRRLPESSRGRRLPEYAGGRPLPESAGVRPLPESFRGRPLPESDGAGALPESVAGRAEPVQGAAVWLRPPESGCEVEASLPTLSAVGGVGGAPDLVRLVDTVATECHRVRLRRVGRGPRDSQALASS
ncbi:SCO3374 family protein [Streptomyces sp. NPDC048277]|uniref:SCO3374 family protein n=1 Tax=Streptomyces sp. NPDC048277 TaxID=3155027 RepID=UPI0033C70CE3